MRERWVSRCATPSAAPTANTRIAGATGCRSIRCEAMNGRKQQLIKRHRRNKRIALLVALLDLLLVGVFVAWWLPLLLVVLGWVAHEAWFADHLFYSPRDDY